MADLRLITVGQWLKWARPTDQSGYDTVRTGALYSPIWGFHLYTYYTIVNLVNLATAEFRVDLEVLGPTYADQEQRIDNHSKDVGKKASKKEELANLDELREL